MITLCGCLLDESSQVVMFLGEEIREAQNLNNDQQHQIHESTATGHETQQG